MLNLLSQLNGSLGLSDRAGARRASRADTVRNIMSGRSECDWRDSKWLMTSHRTQVMASSEEHQLVLLYTYITVFQTEITTEMYFNIFVLSRNYKYLPVFQRACEFSGFKINGPCGV